MARLDPDGVVLLEPGGDGVVGSVEVLGEGSYRFGRGWVLGVQRGVDWHIKISQFGAYNTISSPGPATGILGLIEGFATFVVDRMPRAYRGFTGARRC